ncbi:unnamed protein product [Pylaiella littoralis]
MAGGGSSTETVSMKGSVSLPVKKQNQQYQQQQQRQRALAPLSLVCVECGRPVALLFREYNKGNIRLGRCSYCRSVADKYIECEFVLIAIDLALHRVQAYRHLLFNMKPFSTHSFHGRLWQLGIAMAALDAHLRHTALSSEAAEAAAAATATTNEPYLNVPVADNYGGGGGGGDPFWEAGGLLLAAVIEHACFAAGAVLCAASRIRTAEKAKAKAKKSRRNQNRNRRGSRNRDRNDNVFDGSRQGEEEGQDSDERAEDDERTSASVGSGAGALDGFGGGGAQHRGETGEAEDDDEYDDDPEDHEENEDGYDSSSSYSLPPARSDPFANVAPSASAAAVSSGGSVGAGAGAPRATKMYMAVVYPLFFRLLAAFVMIWDRQVRLFFALVWRGIGTMSLVWGHFAEKWLRRTIYFVEVYKTCGDICLQSYSSVCISVHYILAPVSTLQARYPCSRDKIHW